MNDENKVNKEHSQDETMVSESSEHLPDLSSADVELNSNDTGKQPTQGFAHSVESQAEFPRIGEYQILNQIAKHGQGIVYRANHPLLNRQVVIKISKNRANEKLKQLLVEEGRALARLNHPNLARVYDLILEDDCPCLVIEYIDGQNLHDYMTSRHFTSNEAIDIVAKILSALEHVHDRGIIHRDLKPANVVMQAENGEPRIIDFGLAQSGSTYVEFSISSSVGGTIAYMPPEQALIFSGESAKCDQRSDLFSVGAILFELLTGRRVYEFETAVEGLTCAAHCEIEFQTLESSDHPAALKAICRRALAQDPAQRFQTANDFSEALQATLPKSASKHKSWLKPGIVVTAIILAVTAITLLTNGYFNLTRSPSLKNGAARSKPALADFLNGIQFRHHALSSNDLVVGDLFKNGRVFVDDEMRIDVSFDEPSYCFLFAVNPDGSTQLCYPEEKPDLVQAVPVSAVMYPTDEEYGYAFTEGAGQVAFFVVQSTEPLPSFARWIASQNDLIASVRQTTGSWIWKDKSFTLVSDLPNIDHMGQTRGTRKLTKPRELEQRLKEIEDNESISVRTITFPVVSGN